MVDRPQFPHIDVTQQKSSEKTGEVVAAAAVIGANNIAINTWPRTALG